MTIGSVRVTTRSEWGASEPIWANEVIYYNTAYPLASTYTNIVVHHTNNDQDIRTNEGRERGRGFAAIGYHFFIDKSGKVFEGRPLEVMGSQAGEGVSKGPVNDPDWGSAGIVLRGDYHHADDTFFSEDPPKPQLDALRNLIAGIRSRLSGIGVLLMHKEVVRAGAATVCPGDALYGPIAQIRGDLGLSGPR